ncbi:hypothetical protein F4782DRAFT_10610 [Xylaria castorea]|nr:hypothetical protein F4782DRAFT_10610 [Xylaria castorea]
MWEIAYSIDVAGGSFSWPVGFSTLGASFSYFYGLNFSLDGGEGTFSISPPFNIISGRDNNGSRHEDDDSDDNADGGVSHSIDQSGTPTNAIPDTSLDTPTFSSSSLTFTSTMTTGEVSTNSSGDGYVASGISSRYSSYTTSPTQSLISGLRIGNGAIAGIVIGATISPAAFASLIGLVLYYRHRSSSEKGSSNPEQSRDSKIDGKFKKAELDAEGPQVAITRVYELDATREIQEVGGKMKPAELDSTVLKSAPHTASVQRDSM